MGSRFSYLAIITPKLRFPSLPLYYLYGFLVVLSAFTRYTFLHLGPHLPPAPHSPEPSLFMSVNLPIPGSKTPQERVMVTQHCKYTKHHWIVLPFKGAGFIVYELYLNKAEIWIISQLYLKRKEKQLPWHPLCLSQCFSNISAKAPQ